jgi:Tfp pilus assembly protein PilX
MWKTYFSNERGMAALIAILLVGMLTLLGIAALSTSDDEVQVAGNQWQETKAFYAAESGLDKASSVLRGHYDTANGTPTVLPSGDEDLNGCEVSYSVSDNGAPSPQVISAGAQAGLHALVKSFSVTSTATNEADRAAVTLKETFETGVCPLFQFAVFYGNDLEIAPGADMTLIGRVQRQFVHTGCVISEDGQLCHLLRQHYPRP